MVTKVAGAFLETRWRWPRRYGEIAAYAFLLADPRATVIDPGELVALSEELQLKLFGTSDAGAVCLAALEDDQEAVTRFAAVDAGELRKVIDEGGELPGFKGRISQITPEGVRVVAPPHQAGPIQPVAPTPPPAAPTPRAAPAPEENMDTSYRGVWCMLKDSFIGSGLVARRKGARTFYSTIDGPADKPGPAAAEEFDNLCLKGAPRALVGSQGILFLPISFSSTVHRGSRENYMAGLEGLPASQRPRLAAAVYEVPRAPTFAAIGQIKAFLNPYFSFIDLQTDDPSFQIEALALEAVNSVTFSLPDIDEKGRIAAATRFMASRDAYQRRRIWPAITNVRTRRELAACITLRVPFLSGKAICDHLVAPADPVRHPGDRLPLRETIMMANPQRASVAL
jgi:hypothetical protein